MGSIPVGTQIFLCPILISCRLIHLSQLKVFLGLNSVTKELSVLFNLVVDMSTSNIGCNLPGVSLKIWGNFQSVLPAVCLALETGYHEQLSHMLPVTKRDHRNKAILSRLAITNLFSCAFRQNTSKKKVIILRLQHGYVKYKNLDYII